MSKLVIVTDSTASLPRDVVQTHPLHVIPLNLMWDGITYKDGVDLQPEDFYPKLIASKTLPTTSQPSAAVFHNIFKNLVEQDFEVFGVFISSKMSGTFESATQGLEGLPKERISVFDSMSTAMGMGLQALTMARAAQTGLTLKECAAFAAKVRSNSGVMLAVDTLEYLHRGGRIGGAAWLLATALNLKPILNVVDGRIEPGERIRTRSKSLARLVELICERVHGRTQIRLGVNHATSPNEAQWVLNEASAKLNPLETLMAVATPIVGVHAGPGAISLAYVTE